MCDDYAKQDCFSVTSPYSRSSRVLCITGTLPHVSNPDYVQIDDLVFKLIQLDREQQGEPIVLVINGPGGAEDALWAIADTISLLHSPVYTITNRAFSASAYLFVSGAKGHRYIFKDGRLQLHLSTGRYLPKRAWQFWKQDGREFVQSLVQKSNKLLVKIILDCSDAREILMRLGDWRNENDPRELTRGILTLFKQDQFFNAEEAVRCGLADKIIGQEELDMLFR